MHMNRIGLVGKNGSGKTSVCEYLVQKHGFKAFSLSDVLRNHFKKKSQEATRDALTTYSNKLKAQQGPACLAIECLKLANKNSSNQALVFDSIRHPDEVDYLKKNGVRMCYIDVDINTRYQRILNRQRATDLIDFETFKQHDQRESNGNSSGQNINECIRLCDYVIKNNTSQLALQNEIDHLLSKL